MKKQTAKIVFVVLFVALLFAPSLIWTAAGWKNENLEKRVLTEWPEFSLSKLEQLPGAYEKYHQEHLPFRNQLISIFARAERVLFYKPIVSTVAFGRGDWMYYVNRKQGDPVASYRGEDLFAPEELRQIAVNLRRTQANLRKIGADFILMLVPNKFRIYPEYFPSQYGEMGDTCAMEQLYDFLTAHTNLKVLCVTDDLQQAKSALPDVPLYYTNDTHWTRAGAYVGSVRLLREMGISLPELTADMVRRATAEHVGDLALLTHLNDYLPPEHEAYADASFLPQIKMELSHNNLVHHSWCPEGDARKLFIRTDSFGECMLDYITPCFSETLAMYNFEYEQEAVDEMRPDIFVQVCLERMMWEQLLDGPLYVLPENR